MTGRSPGGVDYRDRFVATVIRFSTSKKKMTEDKFAKDMLDKIDEIYKWINTKKNI